MTRRPRTTPQTNPNDVLSQAAMDIMGEGNPTHDPEVMAKLPEIDATDPLPQPDAEQEPYDVTSYAHVLLSTSDGWTHTPDGRRYVRVNDDHTTNPYLLESSRILGDLANEANRAQAVIHQLDAEMAHLTQDAEFQIQRIQARRDADLGARQARVDDLMKIVAANTIVNGAKESGE